MSTVSLLESYTLPFFDHQIIAVSSSRQFTQAEYPVFLRQQGIAITSLQMVRQVHGDAIVVADEGVKLDFNIEADGLITNSRKVAIAVRTADCLPVFFWDPLQKVAGIAHAGWRGVQAGILPKMVEQLVSDFDCSCATIQVAIGPAIRACCYEVGQEFEEYFPKHFAWNAEKTSGYMDLAAEAIHQVEEKGIRKSQIFDSKICTVCQNHRFFSARKEKTPERILSCIYIK